MKIPTFCARIHTVVKRGSVLTCTSVVRIKRCNMDILTGRLKKDIKAKDEVHDCCLVEQINNNIKN